MNNIQPDIDDLDDYREWYEKERISLKTYAAHKLTPDLAIAVTKLFMPDFMEYEGGIFFADDFREGTFHTWKKQLNGNMTEMEKVMNHRHIDDLLPGLEKPLSDRNLFYFGSVLYQMWKAALNLTFPEKHVVIVAPETMEQFLEEGDFVITFFQERNK
jgi:hypothetical protein